MGKYEIKPWVVEEDDIEIMKNLLLFVDFCRAHDNPFLEVLEWGAGYSTIYYPLFLRSLGISFKWIAIEHDKTWVHLISNRINHYRFDNIYMKYNPLTEVDSQCSGLTPTKKHYVEIPKMLIAGKKYDIIYVDGRLRNRCIKASFNLLSPNGKIILDNADRKRYQKHLHLFKGEFIKPHLWIGSLKK